MLFQTWYNDYRFFLDLFHDTHAAQEEHSGKIQFDASVHRLHYAIVPLWYVFVCLWFILGYMSESSFLKLRAVLLELCFSHESWNRSHLTYRNYFCDLDRKKNTFKMSPECLAWQKCELMFPYLWLIRLLWNVWMNPQELETPKSLLKTHPVLNPGRSKQKIVSNAGGKCNIRFQEKAFM